MTKYFPDSNTSKAITCDETGGVKTKTKQQQDTGTQVNGHTQVNRHTHTHTQTHDTQVNRHADSETTRHTHTHTHTLQSAGEGTYVITPKSRRENLDDHSKARERELT